MASSSSHDIRPFDGLFRMSSLSAPLSRSISRRAALRWLAAGATGIVAGRTPGYVVAAETVEELLMRGCLKACCRESPALRVRLLLAGYARGAIVTSYQGRPITGRWQPASSRQSRRRRRLRAGGSAVALRSRPVAGDSPQWRHEHLAGVRDCASRPDGAPRRRSGRRPAPAERTRHITDYARSERSVCGPPIRRCAGIRSSQPKARTRKPRARVLPAVEVSAAGAGDADHHRRSRRRSAGSWTRPGSLRARARRTPQARSLHHGSTPPSAA